MKSMHKKRKIDAVIFHVVACVIGFFMIYPMLWLLASSFKSNETMFTNTYSLIPEVFDAATNYMNAWEGVAGVSFLTFLGNTVFVTVLAMVGCVFISLLAAYAFTRIKFLGGKFWFSCVMVTLMIPSQVMVVPQYIILRRLNLVDTRIALVLPWFFGTAFFIFMLVQFFRGVPKELDEAAEIDGANRFQRIMRVTIPGIMPTIFYLLIAGIGAGLLLYDMAALIVPDPWGSTIGGEDHMALTLMRLVFYFNDHRGSDPVALSAASAISWILFLLVAPVSVFLYSRREKRMEG